MKTLKILFFLLSCFLFFQVNAQSSSHQVSGNVTDSAGNKMPNVTVAVKGTRIATITDEAGHFSITVPGNKSVIVISSVGYNAQEITAGTQTNIDVVLTVATQTLDDVVVVGYGTTRRKDLTGAISSVNSEHLNTGGTTANIGQALQGRAAGVAVQQTSFAPGAGISIVIRGGNSFNGSNAPLYVVDGFISDNGNQVNPNDIANIDILKDASATAIYGARGANGVILITTKKGAAGKLNIEGSVSHGTQYVSYKPDLITGQQYVDVKTAMAAENGEPSPFPTGFVPANTNWFKEATQDADVDNQNISLSSNNQGSKTFVSLNHLKQDGVLKTTSFERYSARIGTERAIGDKVKIGGNFYGASSKTNIRTYTGDITAPLYTLLIAPPAFAAYNPDGSYAKVVLLPDVHENPLAMLTEPTNNRISRLMNANIYLDYQFIKNLTYHIDAGAEYSTYDEGKYTPATIIAGAANKGIASETINTTTRWLVQQYLTYKFDVKQHHFNILAGTSNQRDEMSYLTGNAKGFANDSLTYYNLGSGSTLVKPDNFKMPPYLLTSYFGRLNYSFNDEIIATLNDRIDQSSLFAPGNRSENFVSGAVAWRLTDKSFIKNLNTFSNLKVRAGYGVAGNDRISTNYSIPPYIATLSLYSTVLMPGGPLQTGFEPSSLPNKSLKWERTGQLNIGLDMGFLENRLTASVDFYSKKTLNNSLLFNIPVGQQWGAATQTINAGSISNNGIELSINSDNVKNKNFTWSTTFNIAYNRQKVKSFAPGISLVSVNTANPAGTVSGREFSRAVVGRELGELYGFQYAGVVKSGEVYVISPGDTAKAGDPKYVDINKDGQITPDDRTFLGNTTPRYTAGFSNQLSYKGFSLNVFFNGAFGYSLYNMNRLVLESTTGADVLNRFVAGKNETTDVPSQGYFQAYGSYVNSRFVEKASYIRLKMVSLSYNIPVKLIKQLNFIDGLQVYANAQNLATITKYSGTDPEVNVHTGNTSGGLDFNSFPAFRTVEFGVKLSLH